jgi:hypothetical protein
MSDKVADGLLLDVHEFSVDDLQLTSPEESTALDLALKRILSQGAESNFNSFGSSV